MKLKISAIILCRNEIDYIKYCLESIKDIVDELIICDGYSTDGTLDIIKEILRDKKYTLIKSSIDDYAHMRNLCLEKAKGDYILVLDGDEILAHIDGSSVERKTLDGLMVLMENNKVDSIDPFTFHFMYNYFTIDGRNNGQHFSLDRFFKPRKGLKYKNKMHETLNWVELNDKNINKIRTITNWNGLQTPIIWHFGHCKGIESFRRKYAQGQKIAKDNDIPFKQELLAFENINDYCKQHELFRGTRPLIHYNGPMPKCLQLW